MSDDANQTEWVTIKIHEPLREDAREDPRTYNDIMRAGLQMPPVVKSQDGDIDLDALADHIVDRLEESDLSRMPSPEEFNEALEGMDGVGDVEFTPYRTMDADIADELAKVRDEIARVPERTASELTKGEY